MPLNQRNRRSRGELGVSAAEFFDGMAWVYRNMSEDWNKDVERLGQLADEIFAGGKKRRRMRVFAPMCGPGTDVLGLALRGYDVTGLDISSKMIDCAKMEARRLGVRADFKIGNITDLSGSALGSFDGAVIFGNSITMLTSTATLEKAFMQIRGKLVPGSLLIFGMRDNEEIAHRARTGAFRLDGPACFSDGRIVHQVWQWIDAPTGNYLCYVYLDPGEGERCFVMRGARCRAWLKKDVEDVLTKVGFTEFAWRDCRHSASVYQTGLDQWIGVARA